jgi:hypothetical protein
MNGYFPALAKGHRVTTERVKVETKYYLDAFCFTRTIGETEGRYLFPSSYNAPNSAHVRPYQTDTRLQ